MRTSIVFLIGAVIAASGCTMLDNPEPSERFQQTLSQSHETNYKVNYEASISGLESLSGLISDISLTSHQDEYKFTTTMNILGSSVNYGVYKTNGNPMVTCTEGGGFMSTSEDSLECEASTTDADVGSMLFDELEESNVSFAYEGEMEFQGRNCEMYNLNTTEQAQRQVKQEVNDSESAVAQSVQEGIGGRRSTLEICLDAEHGYPSYISVKNRENSEISGETEQELITLRGQHETSEVSSEDVQPPVNSVISLSCDPLKANVTSLEFEGESSVEVGEKRVSVSMTPGETETVDLEDVEPSDTVMSTEIEATLIAGETEVADSCRTYESVYDRNTNLTSGLETYNSSYQ